MFLQIENIGKMTKNTIFLFKKVKKRIIGDYYNKTLPEKIDVIVDGYNNKTEGHSVASGLLYLSENTGKELSACKLVVKPLNN